eukprot:CAMPEP_0203883766 /NCGR_PEP_ID=MMETSP0359-20131031/27848_1 /ASSEMBLY_ACC=CAM_ASM_000338 /TAXON_ID=268821 /ORGANISM="Scrippsiella Hangoei, Strain SHTV-5" /LENGTH=68 /DNA_ID=CAMNT_0050804073 /DNA_START=314 /DNA_END=516 /DNA_ORIENTATION=+
MERPPALFQRGLLQPSRSRSSSCELLQSSTVRPYLAWLPKLQRPTGEPRRAAVARIGETEMAPKWTGA